MRLMDALPSSRRPVTQFGRPAKPRPAPRQVGSARPPRRAPPGRALLMTQRKQPRHQFGKAPKRQTIQIRNEGGGKRGENAKTPPTLEPGTTPPPVVHKPPFCPPPPPLPLCKHLGRDSA